MVKTPCKHVFHEQCLWAWFKVRIEQNVQQMISEHSDEDEVIISCPMCNKPVCPGDVPAANAAVREEGIELEDIQPRLIDPPHEGEEAEDEASEGNAEAPQLAPEQLAEQIERDAALARRLAREDAGD